MKKQPDNRRITFINRGSPFQNQVEDLRPGSEILASDPDSLEGTWVDEHCQLVDQERKIVHVSTGIVKSEIPLDFRRATTGPCLTMFRVLVYVGGMLIESPRFTDLDDAYYYMQTVKEEGLPTPMPFSDEHITPEDVNGYMLQGQSIYSEDDWTNMYEPVRHPRWGYMWPQKEVNPQMTSYSLLPPKNFHLCSAGDADPKV